MKRWIGIACFALLIAVLFGTPSGLFSKDPARKEVSRITISATVPEAAPPTGACAGTFAHCVVLGWIAPTKDTNGNPIAGTLSYDVFRSTTSGTGYVKISGTAVSGITYEDDNVTGGVTYFYVVVAYQTANGTTIGPSANSAQTSATGLPVPAPPNPPTGLTAVSN